MQQVRSLSTSDPITSCFKSATRLVFLDTWHVGLNLKTIRHLPPSIRFLRLNPLAFTGRMAVDVFNEAWNKWEGEVLLKLEEIWVPATYAEEELYDPLRATCKRRGVRLVYEREWDKPEGWVMDEEAAFDGAFWDCAAMVDKVLKEEQRRGVEV